MKRFIVFTVCVTLLISCFLTVCSAEDYLIETPYRTGCIMPTSDVYSSQSDLSVQSLSETEELPDLPLYIDNSNPNNSNSKYFPVIGYQGNYGSCVAWSSIYYMYTYEVNRAHDTFAKVEIEQDVYANVEQNVYSPTWVYSLLSPEDGGMRRVSAFNFAKYHGQLSLADCPQYSGAYPHPSLPEDTSAMVRALSTRVAGAYPLEVDTITTPISDPFSNSQLEKVKRKLADGYVLGVDLRAESGLTNSECRLASNGEECIYRISNCTSGHAMTIVGYDDTIWCDINDDGDEDFGETGAFKVANSWGTNWGNEGFVWISYDALNAVSQVEGDWEEDMTSVRVCAFPNHININTFTYIDVEDYEVTLAAVAEIETRSPYFLQTTLSRIDSEDNIVSNERTNYSVVNKSVDYTCFLAFDYGELADPISAYYEEYTWRITTYNYMYAPIASCVMTDNCGNIITQYAMANLPNVWCCDLNLTLGDLDYDGCITMEDVDQLYTYVSNPSSVEFSKLQLFLADANSDGAINVRDALLVYQQVASSDVMMITDEYVELRQVMEELLVEYNML